MAGIKKQYKKQNINELKYNWIKSYFYKLNLNSIAKYSHPAARYFIHVCPISDNDVTTKNVLINNNNLLNKISSFYFIRSLYFIQNLIAVTIKSITVLILFLFAHV